MTWNHFCLPVIAVALGGCAATSADGVHDSFVTGSASLRDGEEAAVLHVASTASFEVLDDEVPLDRRAATNIVEARGEDGFETLEELDAVPYVGEAALVALLAYATRTGLVGTLEADDDVGSPEILYGIAEGSPEAVAVLEFVRTASFEVLDVDVRLDRRAAANIVEAREAGIDTLAELDAIPYVAASAFERLLTYVRDQGLVADPRPEDAFDVQGPEACRGSRETVFRPDALPRTDGRLTVHFEGASSYLPMPIRVMMMTAPGHWYEVAVTDIAGPISQVQSFDVEARLLDSALGSVGEIRVRLDGAFPSACTSVRLTFNCEACLACPEGQEDRGFGCQPVSPDYDHTLLDWDSGRCTRTEDLELTFANTTAVDGAAFVTVEYMGCGGADIRGSMEGYSLIGLNENTLHCGWQTALLYPRDGALARFADGSAVLRLRVGDRCDPGGTCGRFDDPCLRRARLWYRRASP